MRRKILIYLALLAFLSTTSAKMYNPCDFVEELYIKHNIAYLELHKHVCAIKARSSVLSTDNSGEYLGIYRIASEWWCGQNENGGNCNIKCSQLTDDDIADDVKCAAQILSQSGTKAWGRNNCESSKHSIYECISTWKKKLRDGKHLKK